MKKISCPKCGPKEDRPGPNPAWIIPAVGEEAWFTNTEGSFARYKCTYCDLIWDIKESRFEDNIPEFSWGTKEFEQCKNNLLDYVEDFILCDELSQQQRSVLTEKIQCLWNRARGENE